MKTFVVEIPMSMLKKQRRETEKYDVIYSAWMEALDVAHAALGSQKEWREVVKLGKKKEKAWQRYKDADDEIALFVRNSFKEEM